MRRTRSIHPRHTAATVLLVLLASCDDEGSRDRVVVQQEDGVGSGSETDEDGGTGETEQLDAGPEDAGSADAEDAGDDPNDAGTDGGADDASADDASADDGSTDDGSTGCTSGQQAACTDQGLICDAASGACVECTEDDPSACTAQGLSCDLTDGTCVDPLAPWQLDCDDLPSEGTVCEGGPVEVILGTHPSGRVGLFDPQDGHFLGYWKRNDLAPTASFDRYFTFTQAPDLCIWSTRDSDSASVPGVERWNTDGTHRDEILPRGTYYVQDDDNNDRDVIGSPGAIAFTEDSVYVASRDGYPQPRVARFDLEGNFQEVVIDDGSEVEGLLVLGDGSMVIGDGSFSGAGVHHISADRSTRTALWTDDPRIQGGQVTYLGAGRVLAADFSLGGEIAVLDLQTQEREEVRPFFESAGGNNRGVWPLANGHFLLASSSDIPVGSVDPESTSPSGQVTERWNDLAVERSGSWRQFGRACLPEAVVDAVLTEPPEATCPGAPVGDALLAQDFETGAFEGEDADRTFMGFDDPNGRATIDDGVGADGSSRSLRIDGGDADTWYNGVTVMTGDIQPSYVGYWTRVSAVNNYSAALYQGFAILNGEPTGSYQASVGFRRDQIGAWNSRVMQDFEHDTWVRVEMRDFDWDAQTFDLYIDCERVANDIPFEPGAPQLVQRIDFFSRDASSTVWIDELVVK